MARRGTAGQGEWQTEEQEKQEKKKAALIFTHYRREVAVAVGVGVGVEVGVAGGVWRRSWMTIRGNKKCKWQLQILVNA